LPSSQTQVSICNQALGWLGANLITSLDDEGSTEAALCKANFEPVRSAVLEENEWSFAIRRNRLVPITDEEGNWTPAKAFPIPRDTVRVLQLSSDGRYFKQEIEWYVESNMVIVEQLDVVYIRSIFDQTDITQLSPMFNQAFAARLAADIAAPLTENLELAGTMYQLYQTKLGNAVATDALQGKNRRIRSNWMRNARSGYGAGGGSIG
jgi:hypothetical protein